MNQDQLIEPIRLALCAEKDLLTKLEQLFYRHPQFEIIIAANGPQQLLDKLATTQIYPDVIFLGSAIAVMNKQQLIKKLFHEYPGLKTVAILKPTDKIPVLKQLLQFGCNRFIRESKLELFEEELPSLNFGFYNKGFLRGEIFDRCTGILIIIRSFHAYLLNLLGSDSGTEDILLKEGFSEEQLDEHIDELMDQLDSLALKVEALQLGVISRERKRDYLYLKNGDSSVRIRYKDIVLIRSDDNYVKVITLENIAVKDSLPAMYLCTLDYIEEVAADSTLGRPNRTVIVNTAHISKSTKKTVWIKGFEEDITPAYREKFLKKGGFEE